LIDSNDVSDKKSGQGNAAVVAGVVISAVIVIGVGITGVIIWRKRITKAKGKWDEEIELDEGDAELGGEFGHDDDNELGNFRDGSVQDPLW
jgi:hypothetical protein